MKRIILFSLFLISSNVMAQKFEIKFNGINDISIGSNIVNHKDYLIEPEKNYLESAKTKFYFGERYNYYFIKSDSIEINNVGKADDVFIAADKFGNIIMIIIFIKNEFLYPNFANELNQVYEEKGLLATSGIGNSGENILMNWMKNDYSFFIRKQYGSKHAKIIIKKIL